MKYIKAMAGMAAVLLGTVCAEGTPPTYTLQEMTFNIDGSGATYDYFVPLGNPSIPGVNLSGFDTATGLGSIQYSVTGAGQHQFIAFFDHEINLLVNGYLDEAGSSHGTLGLHESWEIDEPGYGNFLGYTGDIYNNVVGSGPGHNLLDNRIGDSTTNPLNPNDISLALGFDFSLAAGEKATIDLSLSTTAPNSGFYLQQQDPGALPSFEPGSVFLSGNLSISPIGAGVPDAASTFSALSLALVGLIGFQQRFARR